MDLHLYKPCYRTLDFAVLSPESLLENLTVNGKFGSIREKTETALDTPRTLVEWKLKKVKPSVSTPVFYTHNSGNISSGSSGDKSSIITVDFQIERSVEGNQDDQINYACHGKKDLMFQCLGVLLFVATLAAFTTAVDEQITTVWREFAFTLSIVLTVSFTFLLVVLFFVDLVITIARVLN